MKRFGLLLIILLCVSACTTAQSNSAPTPQPPGELQPTPTPEEVETSDTPLFSVTFEGASCNSDVPEKLPMGKYSFLVVNDSDREFALWITLLPEDISFQDLLDQQEEPGKFYNAPYELRTPTKLAQRWDDTLGGKFYTFSFTEEAEYAVALGGLNLDELWFCSPFHIVAESAKE